MAKKPYEVISPFRVDTATATRLKRRHFALSSVYWFEEKDAKRFARSLKAFDGNEADHLTIEKATAAPTERETKSKSKSKSKS